MRTQALLITLALVAVLAALPLAESKVRGAKAGKWPCCDNCGVCTRKLPPDCLCNDTSPRGCHPACKSCDKFTDDNGATLFVCRDRITNFCQRRCTPAV